MLVPTPSTAGPAGHDHPVGHRLKRWFVPHRLPPPINPALLRHSEKRAQDAQNRVADWITAFSGSMAFVYIHIIWFSCWIGFGVEHYPYGLLTMIVSLEAIFLSTFVLISQNRADARRQVLADEEWRTVMEEDQQNKELLDLSRQTLELTKQMRAFGNIIDQERDQNRELLDLSRKVLTLTTQLHEAANAGGPGGAGG
jgi:uncharacterized membrane protein